MNSNASRELERVKRLQPSAESVADATLALLNGHAVFRFLTETFAALDSGQVDLTLSSDAAGGLSRICEQAAGELIDAYGRL